MPWSQQPKKGQKMMLQKILEREPKRVVDVGAGAGKWGTLLREATASNPNRPFLTAIEVWLPYVVQYGLNQIYDEVRVVDLRRVTDWPTYDIVILGDVLEHLPREDALQFIVELRKTTGGVYLTIPITDCPQDGELAGNPFEHHHVQWNRQQLEELGFGPFHIGPNEDETVTIGTFELCR